MKTKQKTINLTALGLSGPEWIKRLEKNKYNISSWVKELLNSPNYEKHRYKKGEKLTLALVKHQDVGINPTTREIQNYAKAQGYEMPKAELALLVREAMTDEEIKALGLWYIVALHDPISDSDGDPHVLDADRGGDGRWVDAHWVSPGDRWYADGASAFLLPASGTKNSDPKLLPSDTLTLKQRVEKIEEVLKFHNLI